MTIKGKHKITIFSPVYPRPRRPDSGKYIENLAVAWKADGHSIDVLTVFTFADRLREGGLALFRFIKDGVAVKLAFNAGIPFGRLLPSWLKNFLMLIDRKIMQVNAGTSCVGGFIYCQFAVAAFWAYRAKSRHGAPYFVDLGESSSLVGVNLTEGLHRIDEAQVVRNSLALRHAAGVICVSPRLQREAWTLGVDPKRSRVVPNWPDADIFREMSKSECRAALNIAMDEFLVIYVGHLSDRKGAGRLDQALCGMRGSPMAVFLGNGTMPLNYQYIVKRGLVTHQELALWLNASDVLSIPTLGEGCCNAIAEALQCGLPVVTSDIEDVVWQVPEGGGVFHDPADVESLKNILDELMETPEQLNSMREVLRKNNETSPPRARSDAVMEFIEECLQVEN